MRIHATDTTALWQVFLNGEVADVEAADTDGWADVVDAGPNGETRRIRGRVEIVNRETGEVWR